MYVLVDLEWVTLDTKRNMPSQLAALRVTSQWEIVSSFSRLCRPRGTTVYDWSHIGFSGNTEEAFRSAPTARSAFEDFCSWIQPDDILLWWKQDPKNMFSVFLSRFRSTDIPNSFFILSSIFRSFIRDGKKAKGNIYELAGSRQIPLLEPEHCAWNDVNMLRNLLSHVQFQVEWLQTPLPTPPKAYSTNFDLSQPFQLDTDTNTLHLKGCTLLEKAARIEGNGSLRPFIKQKVTPCPICCKKEWDAFITARNNDIIARSKCHFFFLPEGRSFHRPDCFIIQKSAIPPSGVMYFLTAYESGRLPCKRCNPVAQEDSQIKKSLSSPSFKPSALPRPSKFQITNVSLTNAEKQALKRHKQASKERRITNDNLMSPEEKHDFYTLTATRFAFWAAHGYSNFHERNCPRLNGLTNLQGFPRYSDAVGAGYKPCRQCKPSAKSDAVLSIPINNQIRFGESAEEIIALCESKGFQCSYTHPTLSIETSVGRWIVDITRRPIFIEHQHTTNSPKGPSALHWQHRMFLSLTDVVLYIEKHDNEDLL